MAWINAAREAVFPLQAADISAVSPHYVHACAWEENAVRHWAGVGTSRHEDSELACLAPCQNTQLTPDLRFTSALAWINAARQAVFPPRAANISAVKPRYVNLNGKRTLSEVGGHRVTRTPN